MSYNRFADDEEDRPQTKYPQETSEALSTITSAFNQLDGAIKNVEEEYLRLEKCNDPAEFAQYTGNMQEELNSLQAVNLPQIENAILLLQRSQAQIQVADEQVEIQAMVNRFNQLYNNKKQQISNFSNAFEKIIAQKSQSNNDEENAAQNLENFQMKMMQEEVDDEIDVIKECHEEMHEINNLMKTMAVTVEKEGETINLISDRVTDADKKVEVGVDNLEKAKATQKKANKWLFWGLGVFAVVIVVLILVFTL